MAAAELTPEQLHDLFLGVYDELSGPRLRRDRAAEGFVFRFAAAADALRAAAPSRDDYEPLSVLARGAFGHVRVVRHRATGEVCAMKIVDKQDVLRRKETSCFMDERDALVSCDRSWIVDLLCAFQDATRLHLVTRFCPGGDLVTALSKTDSGRFDEAAARFYLAEVAMAVGAVHKAGFAHRDVRLDSVLLGEDGHTRLGDFGSCCRVGDDGLVRSRTAVGTPDYVAPEVVRAVRGEGDGSYGRGCDWWAVGVCLYEMLVGETPFYSETLSGTYARILDHASTLHVPVSGDDAAGAGAGATGGAEADCLAGGAGEGSGSASEEPSLSRHAADLVRRLLCEPENRLGGGTGGSDSSGLAALQGHPFFAGLDWGTLASQPAPHTPVVLSPHDTSNFDVDDDDDDDGDDGGDGGGGCNSGWGADALFSSPSSPPPPPTSPGAPATALAASHAPFVGFTHFGSSGAPAGIAAAAEGLAALQKGDVAAPAAPTTTAATSASPATTTEATAVAAVAPTADTPADGSTAAGSAEHDGQAELESVRATAARQTAVIAILRREVAALRDEQAQGGAAAEGRANWRNRRSLRLDRQGLRALEQQRDAEVRAKVAAEERLGALLADKEALINALQRDHAAEVARLRSERDAALAELEMAGEAHAVGGGGGAAAAAGVAGAADARAVDAGGSAELAGVAHGASSAATTPQRAGAAASTLAVGATPSTHRAAAAAAAAASPSSAALVSPSSSLSSLSAVSPPRVAGASEGANDLTGWFMAPAPDGLRKGWRQAWVACRGALLTVHEHRSRVRHRRDRALPSGWHRAAAADAEETAFAVLDMSSDSFDVAAAGANDAIHAPAKHVAAMLRVSCRARGGPRVVALLLAPSVELARAWVDRLRAGADAARDAAARADEAASVPDEADGAAAGANVGAEGAAAAAGDAEKVGGASTAPAPSLAAEARRRFAVARLVGSRAVPEARRATCCARVGARLLIGTPGGLLAVDSSGRVTHVGDVKKVTDVVVLPEQHSILVCGGRKASQLRLVGINAALRGKDDDVCKIVESRGVRRFAHCDCADRKTRVAFAVGARVGLCEVTLQSYRGAGEIELTAEPTALAVVRSGGGGGSGNSGAAVIAAHGAVFTLYGWAERVPTCLVARGDPTLRFVFTARFDGREMAPVTVLQLPAVASASVAVSSAGGLGAGLASVGGGGGSSTSVTSSTSGAGGGHSDDGGDDGCEYLLCYTHAGVVVDGAGRRSASRLATLRWLEPCRGFELAPPFVVCFGASAVHVVSVDTGETAHALPVDGGGAWRCGRPEMLLGAAGGAEQESWLGLVTDADAGGSGGGGGGGASGAGGVVAAAEPVEIVRRGRADSAGAKGERRPRRASVGKRSDPAVTSPRPGAASISSPVGFTHVAHVGKSGRPGEGGPPTRPQHPEDYFKVATPRKQQQGGAAASVSPVAGGGAGRGGVGGAGAALDAAMGYITLDTGVGGNAGVGDGGGGGADVSNGDGAGGAAGLAPATPARGGIAADPVGVGAASKGYLMVEPSDGGGGAASKCGGGDADDGAPRSPGGFNVAEYSEV